MLIELLLYVLSISCFAIMYTQTESREYLRKKWVFVEFHSQLFFNNQNCDFGEISCFFNLLKIEYSQFAKNETIPDMEIK